MKPDRMKSFFKSYMGIGIFFMLLVYIGIYVLLCQ